MIPLALRLLGRERRVLDKKLQNALYQRADCDRDSLGSPRALGNATRPRRAHVAHCPEAPQADLDTGYQ